MPTAPTLGNIADRTLCAQAARSMAEPLEQRLLLAATVIYRVNAGGPLLSASPSWQADTAAAPSTYVNASATGNQVYNTTSAIDISDPSVPSGTPAALFQTERWDPAGGSELQYSFPVTPGSYTVRLYFAEIYSGAMSTGARKFNVGIEGQTVLSNYDVYADVGGNKGVVKTFNVNSDATLNIVLGHVTENPAIKGIEIINPNGGPAPVGFGKSQLAGTSLSNPTSLQWGPDGKLYVAQQNGIIKVFSVNRTAANAYSVTNTQTINLIYNIPNHNDDGSLNPSVVGRQCTGLLVTGTAANPVIFVTSADPRIGGPPDQGGDTNLDTNSGIISKLTWNGSAWVKQDLVRGLPRSEENHSQNGMAYSAATNTLYVTSGGNTNMGAPSTNFALLPEYALSAAILSVNLGTIGSGTYDLPTLDDDSRSGSADANDPFGGNDGKNQAKLVPGGPVQVYSPGFRNPYDVVIAQSGKMYTIDNGANAGWGDVPIGSGGSATNQQHEPGITTQDNLHVITAGFYGGHPNPTRANPGNTWNNPAQSPVSSGNPAEGYFLTPGVNDGALALYPASTNGLVEYTASNFGNAMKGNLLAASFDNKVYRVQLSGTGTSVSSNAALFSNVGSTPLDVTAVGDAGPFPGTIWVADYSLGKIIAFEPNDYGGGGGGGTGADDPNLDEDFDTYNNHDEILNGTNPLSAADVPPDWDYNPNSSTNDSNLLDPNDDNDLLSDTVDPFAIDPANGKTTNLPISYTWDNNVARPGGILDMGFTGLMTNGSANYESLYSASGVTAGGAAGVFTIDAMGEGTAHGAANTQTQAFQFGLNVGAGSAPFVIHTSILAPFAGLTPQAGQEMGLFFGNGDQNNYVELAITASGISFMQEFSGNFAVTDIAAVGLPGPAAIDLYLTINPQAGTVQPAYQVTSGGVKGPLTNLGSGASIPAAWFTSATAPAVGLIGTSAGPAPEFPVTYDFITVSAVAGTQSPFGGTPIAVPGLIQAENFDLGGQGVAYSDTEAANLGNSYRTSEGPDLEATTDSGGGYDVGWVKAGEWLEYTLSIATAGSYNIGVRVASTTAGGKFHLELDGAPITASLTMPSTGGWQNWQTLAVNGVNLPAGQHVLRLAMDSNASNGYVGNFNWIQIAGPISNQTPFGGSPIALPGTIQAENFDLGGQNVAYADTESANQGGAYRPGEGVDLQATTDSGGGYNVGWTKAGEWLEYTVTVASSGSHSISVRLANPAAGGKFHIEIDGVNVTGSLTVPNTGGWQTWQTLTISNISLTAGQHILRLALDTNASNGFVGNINWIQVNAAAQSSWASSTAMPTALGEVAGGIINGKMYMVGEGSSSTMAYDLAAKTWTTAAARPFVGGHHAAEVINNKLYLFGGLGGSSEGKVQIYDPATNSWSAGAAMPFAAGSVATGLIAGKVYVAGGILANNTTTSQAAVYNVATNSWSSIASMPQGRNHTAAATDGSKLYLFGGRDGGNVVANGFNTVQIYNPATNTWQSSASSALAPLPQARGGMGKAVYYNGEFYVIGGETLNGAGATAQNVYNRVDIYKPVTNTWRLGPAMPTARHGIFPLLSGAQIYVAGGGVTAGFSQSKVLEILTA